MSDRHITVEFPTRECPSCGREVDHRVERDYKKNVEATECSNCHHKATEAFGDE